MCGPPLDWRHETRIKRQVRNVVWPRHCGSPGCRPIAKKPLSIFENDARRLTSSSLPTGWHVQRLRGSRFEVDSFCLVCRMHIESGIAQHLAVSVFLWHASIGSIHAEQSLIPLEKDFQPLVA